MEYHQSPDGLAPGDTVKDRPGHHFDNSAARSILKAGRACQETEEQERQR